VAIPLLGYTNGGAAAPLSYAPPDPAYAFLSSGTPQDARCVGACVRLGFEQPVSNMQGRLAYLDLPQNILDEAITLGGGTITVDALFNLSTKVVRADMAQHEVRWRPTDGDDTFRYVATYPGAATDDSAVKVSAGTFTLPGVKYGSFENRWIGFAYYGLSSTNAYQTRIDLYKNIEWRPRAGLSMALPIETPTSAVPPFKEAESLLQKAFGEWQFADVVDMGAAVAKKVVEYAYLGNSASKYPSLMAV